MSEEREYHEQQEVRRKIEGNAARSAKHSQADRWATGEIERIRRGERQPMYGPDATPPDAEQRE